MIEDYAVVVLAVGTKPGNLNEKDLGRGVKFLHPRNYHEIENPLEILFGTQGWLWPGYILLTRKTGEPARPVSHFGVGLDCARFYDVVATQMWRVEIWSGQCCPCQRRFVIQACFRVSKMYRAGTVPEVRTRERCHDAIPLSPSSPSAGLNPY